MDRDSVLEGTWWRQRALDLRLPHLSGVRELGMPDLWHGWLGDVPVAYCPAYGAPRAVEPVHVLAVCGTPVVVQVGSCGGLQPQVRTGDVVLSSRASIGEGASQYYGGRDACWPDGLLVDQAAALLTERGLRVHRGTTMSTSALLQQPDELVAAWDARAPLGWDATDRTAVAKAAVMLLSDFFPATTGQVLHVNGGTYLGG